MNYTLNLSSQIIFIKCINRDATKLVEGEKVTLMKWGNFIIKKIEKQENESLVLIADYLAEDKDFKNTKKINWLSV